MSDGETFSDEQLRLIAWVPILCFGGNVAAFALSLATILRFTRQSMRDIKLHLVNIATMVFVSDALMDLLTAPTPVYPYMGAASMSGAAAWIGRLYGNRVAAFAIMAPQITFLGASAAAVCNATLHRFWVTKNAEKAQGRTPGWLLGWMGFWQLVYMPVMGVTFATVNPMPDYVQRIYEEQFPDALAKLATRPHFISLNLFRTFRENPLFAVGVTMTAIMVAIAALCTTLFSWLSWRLLNRMQLSARALRMRRQLVLSMLLQSFLPMIAYGLGLILIFCTLYFRPQRSTPLVMPCYLVFGMHSAINCAAMCWAIPPYRRGLAQMLKSPAQRLMARTVPKPSTDSVTQNQRVFIRQSTLREI